MLDFAKPAITPATNVTKLHLLSSEQLTELAIRLGLQLAGALVVFYIGLKVVKWVARLISRALTRAHVEPTAMQFMSRLTYVVLVVVLVLAILQIFFDVAPTSLIAVLGAAGLAIGLALKDSLSNVASGVMLVTLRPFRVGDIVQIAGSSGKVEAVSIFQTRLRGADNQTIVLPNNLITTAPIINLTPDTMRRVELIIGIGYTDDIDAAREAIMSIMRGDQRILAEPAPTRRSGWACVAMSAMPTISRPSAISTNASSALSIRRGSASRARSAMSAPFAPSPRTPPRASRSPSTGRRVERGQSPRAVLQFGQPSTPPSLPIDNR